MFWFFLLKSGGSVAGRSDDDAVAQFVRVGRAGHVPGIAAVASAQLSAESERLPSAGLVQRQFHRPAVAHSGGGIGAAGQSVEPRLSERIVPVRIVVAGHSPGPLQSGSAGGQHRREHEDPRERLPHLIRKCGIAAPDDAATYQRLRNVPHGHAEQSARLRARLRGQSAGLPAPSAQRRTDGPSFRTAAIRITSLASETFERAGRFGVGPSASVLDGQFAGTRQIHLRSDAN